jgi:hypothetical protein
MRMEIQKLSKVSHIYVGGPVGKEISDGAGLLFRDHSTNLDAATREIARLVNGQNTGHQLAVLDPSDEKFTGFKYPALAMLNEADIGVIDLSVASPSAMYEAALMHALGKPVVPITLAQVKVPEGRNLCQYMKDDLASLVPDYQLATLVDLLLPKVQRAMAMLGDSQMPAQISNPVTQFYGHRLAPVAS